MILIYYMLNIQYSNKMEEIGCCWVSEATATSSQYRVIEVFTIVTAAILILLNIPFERHKYPS